MPHVEAVYSRFGFLYCLGGGIADGAYGQNGHLLAIFQAAARAHLYFLERVAPVCEHAVSARIADYKRAHAVQLGGVHQVAQLVFVHGRGYGKVGYGAQGGNVERAVVRRPVLAHKPGAV